MSYSLTSSVDPSKYFSQIKFRVLARLPARPNVSELRTESSSARSASNLLIVDSTTHPEKPAAPPRIARSGASITQIWRPVRPEVFALREIAHLAEPSFPNF